MKNWGVYILLAIGAGAYHMYNSADRDASGAIVGAGSMDVLEIRVGDCFDDEDVYSEQVSTLPVVPCSEPHDNEAYATFNASGSSYPGEDALWEIANEGCYNRFEQFVGRDYESSQLDFFAMTPTRQSWASNERRIVCALYDMDLAKLTGTMKDSKK